MNQNNSLLISIAKGVIGAVFLTFSFYLLFQDESVSLRKYIALKNAMEDVISVENSVIDPKNNGELIHINGELKAPLMHDETFGIKIEAIELERVVEMYQWQENEKIETKKDSEGNKIKKHKYKYVKMWSSDLLDSEKFYLNKSYENPNHFKYRSAIHTSERVLLGKFSISNEYLEELEERKMLDISDYISSLKKFERVLGKRHASVKYPKEFKIVGGMFYNGKDMKNPEIGDIRIRYDVILPFKASIVGKQDGSEISSYEYSDGESILVIKRGILNKDEVIGEELKRERSFEIKVGILSFVLMFIGFILIKKPLRRIILKIPYFGILIAFSSSLRFLLISLLLTLISTGLVWMPYTPAISIPIVTASVVALVFIREKDYYR